MTQAPATDGTDRGTGPDVVEGPVRMCVGCRRRRPASELIRLRVEAGRLAIVRAPGQGRSAYLCPQTACLEQAVQRRAFSRALREQIKVDDGLPGTFREELQAREAVR